MLHIDLEKAKSLVEECVVERGEDFTYVQESGNSCKYVHDISEVWNEDTEEYEEINFDNATPGCLVGTALHKAGIPLEVMGAGHVNTEGSFDLLRLLEERGLLTYTGEAAAYFGNAQASQDNGAPWGASAKAALKGESLQRVYDSNGRKTDEFSEYENYLV